MFEVLPPGSQIRFPGYQDVVLTRAELQDIFATSRLHRDWKVTLSSTAGIYRIVDHHNGGGIYIGAAYRAGGIWGSWGSYARTGHGGNRLLKPLDSSHFRWSIVRTLSGSMSEKELIQVERIEMRKHGSKAVGLNS